MSGPQPLGATDVPTAPCRRCETDVPAGTFCGQCGAWLAEHRGRWRDLLRPRAHAAAPGEHVLRPALASTLFPHLPHRSRTPFRIGLAVLLLALITVGALRWQAPLVAISAVGFPLLFVLYLDEADAFRDLRARVLLMTAVPGVVLGVGWARLTGAAVAQSYDVALGEGVATETVLREGLLIPLGGATLMVIPALVMRLARPPTRESLDGFLIGVSGAIAFTAAATLTRLAPELAAGTVAHDRSIGAMLVEAGVQGVVMPLTSAAAGGLVGAALWFTGSAAPGHRHRWPAGAVAVAFAFAAALGLIDVTQLHEGVKLALQLVVMIVALFTLRVGLHLALLHEAHDPSAAEPLLCQHCGHVIPDMAFCPNCGVAARASSRSSRSARRGARPVPIDTGQTPTEPTWPGYVVPAARYAAAPLRKNRPTQLLLTVATGLVPIVALAAVVCVIITPKAAHYVCPPDCGKPPIGTPVQILPRFSPADGAFSVAYPQAGSAYHAAITPHGVLLNYLSGDRGTLKLYAEAAGNRTPRQIAKDLIKRSFPDAAAHYEIPNAMLGYQPGYGEVDDDYPDDIEGRFTHLRVLVIVAVKNGLALEAAAVGPYHEFSPSFGSGRPSGAGLELALDMGKYVNSFTWRGDPPR
jgi:hypothetical protein